MPDRNHSRPRPSIARIKIHGRRPVLEAMEAELPLNVVYFAAGAQGTAIDRIRGVCEKSGTPFRTLKKSDVDKLAGTPKHQGVVAVMDGLPRLTLRELVQRCSAVEQPALALLDGVEDPHNLGAIMRVADGAGLQGLVVPRRRSAALGGAAIKTSAGAAFHLPVAEVSNLARAIDLLKQDGFWIVGTEMDAEQRPWDLEMTMPVAFVLGGEGKGMHRLVREKCDHLVSLPMHGKVGSLNVATAAAVLFYELVRQKESRTPPDGSNATDGS